MQGSVSSHSSVEPCAVRQEYVHISRPILWRDAVAVALSPSRILLASWEYLLEIPPSVLNEFFNSVLRNIRRSKRTDERMTYDVSDMTVSLNLASDPCNGFSACILVGNSCNGGQNVEYMECILLALRGPDCLSVQGQRLLAQQEVSERWLEHVKADLEGQLCTFPVRVKGQETSRSII